MLKTQKILKQEFIMNMEEFIIEVFFMVDEHIKKVIGSKKFRQRGFSPKISTNWISLEFFKAGSKFMEGQARHSTGISKNDGSY